MRTSRILTWAIGISIIILSASAAIYWIFFRAPIEAIATSASVGNKIVGDLKEFLNFDGRITINGTTVIERNRDVTELAIREKTFEHRHEWKHTWGGSTKVIELKGSFTGKAGYDFTGETLDSTNPWGIDVSEDGNRITVKMPKPSILSVETSRYEILTDEDGLWNKVSKDDRQEAVNALLRDARAELENSGILDEVDGAFLQRIEEAVRRNGPQTFEIIRQPAH